jgi:hypothetical protein
LRHQPNQLFPITLAEARQHVSADFHLLPSYFRYQAVAGCRKFNVHHSAVPRRRRATRPRFSSRSSAEDIVEIGAPSASAILRTFHFSGPRITTSKPTSPGAAKNQASGFSGSG